MRVEVAPGWRTELDRGPDWLFVKLFGPDGDDADATGLAEMLHLLMQEELAHRLVLELDGVGEFPLELADELVTLHGLVEETGGMVRLCGVAPEHRAVLRTRDDACSLAPYRDRTDAVMGAMRPNKPR